MVQSTIIVTDGENSIFSHGDPIPANESDTLAKVATAPRLTSRQRLTLAGLRVVIAATMWVLWRGIMGGSEMSFWYEAIGGAMLFYHWAIYWRVFDRMARRQSFLLDILAHNDIVGDDNYVLWYLEDACLRALAPLSECCGVWTLLLVIRHGSGGIEPSNAAIIIYAVVMFIGLELALHGRMMLIEHWQLKSPLKRRD